MVFCNIIGFKEIIGKEDGHNPYFNRWFSAITDFKLSSLKVNVTILILIDGFLQCENPVKKTTS